MNTLWSEACWTSKGAGSEEAAKTWFLGFGWRWALPAFKPAWLKKMQGIECLSLCLDVAWPPNNPKVTCKWIYMETSGGGEGRFLKPFGWLAFLSEARKHLSYSLWLKACIAKLVISLATCHTSTTEEGNMGMFGFAISNRP